MTKLDNIDKFTLSHYKIFKYLSQLLMIPGYKKINLSLTDFNNSFKHDLMNTALFGMHKHTQPEHILGYKVQVNTFQRISILQTVFSGHMLY